MLYHANKSWLSVFASQLWSTATVECTIVVSREFQAPPVNRAVRREFQAPPVNQSSQTNESRATFISRATGNSNAGLASKLITATTVLYTIACHAGMHDLFSILTNVLLHIERLKCRFYLTKLYRAAIHYNEICFIDEELLLTSSSSITGKPILNHRSAIKVSSSSSLGRQIHKTWRERINYY